MKEKILNALKTKYKNLGFGDTAFDSVATYLEASVTEDGQIDTSISGVETLLKSFQTDVDRRITLAVQKAKTESKEGVKLNEKEAMTPTAPQEEIPSWFKSFSETITSKINAIETGKVSESRKTILETKLANAVPAVKAKILKDFQRMNFEKNEDFENYLTETEEDLKGLNQDFANQGLSNSFSPGVGGKQVTDSVLESEIKAWAETK